MQGDHEKQPGINFNDFRIRVYLDGTRAGTPVVIRSDSRKTETATERLECKETKLRLRLAEREERSEAGKHLSFQHSHSRAPRFHFR